MRRKTLGILALLLLAVGIIAAFRGPPDGSARGFAGGCIRVGLVLGALWLAWPQIQGLLTNLPRRMAAWVAGLFTRRGRSTPERPCSEGGDPPRESSPRALRPRRRRG